MNKELRKVCYDKKLCVEAYQFKGIMQKFPNHFHEYFVIGFIEKGKRKLECKGITYFIDSGDLTLFNPFDIHTCEQIDHKTLDYRCINIKPARMAHVVYDITGRQYTPQFQFTHICHSPLVPTIKELHSMIMKEEKEFKKEELFYFLIEQLLAENILTLNTQQQTSLQPRHEIALLCEYLKTHYMESISLDNLSALTGLSKWHLLRSFTKEKGISPYSYLETIRIDQSKKLLEQGVDPIDVAFQTGFCDQSHFTNSFKKYIGLTPKQYMKIFS